ncbi:hypothetical protein HBZS_123690 [Helicobacter bizzozeronii CCUG 35545]|nr:hypothetical protein HBZS_123690 [Helicobacter bizzozeronii CCUG 35545]
MFIQDLSIEQQQVFWYLARKVIEAVAWIATRRTGCDQKNNANMALAKKKCL